MFFIMNANSAKCRLRHSEHLTFNNVQCQPLVSVVSAFSFAHCFIKTILRMKCANFSLRIFSGLSLKLFRLLLLNSSNYVVRNVPGITQPVKYGPWHFSMVSLSNTCLSFGIPILCAEMTWLTIMNVS